MGKVYQFNSKLPVMANEGGFKLHDVTYIHSLNRVSFRKVFQIEDFTAGTLHHRIETFSDTMTCTP